MIASVVPVLSLLYRASRIPDRLLVIIVSVFVGHTAWHWLTERLEALRKADWSVEPLSATGIAAALVTVAVIGGLLWVAVKVCGNRRRTPALQQRSARG